MQAALDTVANDTSRASLPVLDILGLPIATASRGAIRQWLLGRQQRGEGSFVATPNAEILLQSRKSGQTRDLLLATDLLVADGIGLVKAAAWLRGVNIERYPGIELAEDLMHSLAESGGSVYLLGASAEVVQQAAANLTQRYPALNIAGYRDGYFTPDEEAAIAEGIRSANADLLLVGMGCPKQEGFIYKYRGTLGCPLMLGIGGALEVWAGSKRRAPRWVQSVHLEWLYRALQDPKRIGRTFSMLAFFGLLWTEKRRLARLAASGGRP